MPNDQQPGKRPGRTLSPSIESLEGRALLSTLSLLSGGPIYGPTPTPTPTTTPAPITTTTPAPTATSAPGVTTLKAASTVESAITTTPPRPLASGSVVVLPRSEKATTPPPASPPHGVHVKVRTQHAATGMVTKSPRFYPFYTGPKLAELDAVKASAELTTSGTLVFTGTNKGRIDSSPAVYVWGVDRNGNLPPGPFTDRPNVAFDALVVVRLDASLTPTAQVVDLASGTTTDLAAGAASIHGKTVKVTVPLGLLPSTGLTPAQYRFNYWPEDGGPPVSASVASFAPELNNAQVGTVHHG